MNRAGVRSGDTTERLPDRASWAVLAAALVVTVAPGIARAQPASPPHAPALLPQAQAPNALAPPDSPVSQPQAQEQVLLEADLVTEDDTAHTVTAGGDVEVRYQGRTMRAD